ncbi:MAG TPA: exo-alpha-sialidase [Candidatus Hydrogenedentes bacterium]|nr:exo-alpha-sialidase [Candidatus Hydrogenedentota bacterium]HPC15255.1 exo-alpha-sialidase [Candidatus Hydrogenedentota bacterium]HRT19490.1 exo-alpha-sialidase [Candidatus Hydrogenedentota bacterium]HRT64254.1 exo-alpha-sialidase [Candidatus Hydrogenedentota bacterium]
MMWTLGIVAGLAAYGQAALTPDVFLRQVIEKGGGADFIFGDDRPFPECHASTLVETGNGTLLCAWFGGTKEKDPDVGIWTSRFANGTWSPVKRTAKIAPIAHWNPVLFRDPKRATYLFFKVGPSVPSWQTYWMQSGDDGETWSDPVELAPGDRGGRGPVKNKPIILSDGAWLAPASTEEKAWKAFADRSEDGGKTWQRSDDFFFDVKKTNCRGAIQPTFWESAPGHVHALMRTTAGKIARADSSDGGKTWAPAEMTDLPNNNSGIDALRLDDGRVLLVYNPVARNWGPRTPLTLTVSKDNGQTWSAIADLETAPGEYSYPAIVRTSNGVAISYTWKRERIRCWRIPDEVLK